MRILRRIAGAASLAIAVWLWAPIAVVLWADVFSVYLDGEGHADLVTFMSVGGLELSGWQMWAASISFALLGVVFAFAGVYAFRSKKTGP